MQLLADDLVVIAKGDLIAAETMKEFLSRASAGAVVVRTTDSRKLAEALQAQGLTLVASGVDELRVPDVTSDRVGHIAFAAGVPILELRTESASLESVFLELTENAQEYRVGGAQ
jgi:ABC-2 type transport system ATP-binding protein